MKSIDSKALIERVEPYLERSPDLFEYFKRFINYKDDGIICKFSFI